MLLQGLFVPLTCPFYRDGASYLRKLEHNVARYSLSPVAGLIALPPGGEASALTDAEAHSAFQSVAETARPEKVLLAGIERSSLVAALNLAEAAHRAQFDAVLLSAPPDWARLVRGEDARELLTFFQAFADRSPLPIVLWSDPKPPSLELPAELVATLGKHRNVLGLIDAGLTEGRLAQLRSTTESIRRDVTVTSIFEAVTLRMLRPQTDEVTTPGLVPASALTSGGGVSSAATAVVVAPVLKTRTKAVGFQILSASPASSLVPLLSAGAAGASPTVAACAPQACFETYAAWKDGDTPLALERGERLRKIEEVVERLGPAAVKAGCDFNGYFGGLPRLPRLPLTAENRAEVEQALTYIRN